MYIKFWGCRGGIPVSGEKYLFYGGETTCVEIRDQKGNLIIIDGGSGIRNLGKKILLEEKFDINMIFTHVHWDHIIGLPFFSPLYDKRFKINIFGDNELQENIFEHIFLIFSAPFFPVNSEELSAEFNFIPIKKETKIGDINLKTISLSHPNGGIGLKFYDNDKSFVFLTDNELGFVHRGGKEFEEYVEFCKNADLLVHDAEYTEEEHKKKIGWGHSSIDDVIRLAIDSKVNAVGFFHHNQDHSDEDLKKMENYAKKKLKGKVESFVVFEKQEIVL